jgi:hypothetical protein
MLWLTWRQHRAEALGGLLLLAALAALLLVTGLPMHAAYSDQGVAACVAGGGRAAGCDTLLEQFTRRYVGLGDQVTLLTVLPALAGVFVGAPLLGRELEHGTWRLAWAQGVTRTRWLVVKLALLTATVSVLAVGFTVLFTWWRGPLDGIQGRFDGAAYNFEGAVPTASAVFAFALGTLAGTLARRTIPAMALTFLRLLDRVAPAGTAGASPLPRPAGAHLQPGRGRGQVDRWAERPGRGPGLDPRQRPDRPRGPPAHPGAGKRGAARGPRRRRHARLPPPARHPQP